MTSLFFILATFFMLFEIHSIYYPRKHVNFTKKLSKENYELLKSEEKVKGCLWVFLHLLYLVWAVIGLAISSQWHFFLILLLSGLVFGLISKMLPDTGKVFIKVVDSSLSATLLAWLFMNHFHPGFLPVIF